jgi:AraC-like DNA-binding protein
MVNGYAMRRGARTGALLWRAFSPGPEHQIATDGVMDLMWFQGRVVVAGADTRSVTVKTRAGEATWGLQLAPGVAHLLLRVPADELTDQRIDLSELTQVPGMIAASFEEDIPAALEQLFVTLWSRTEPDRATLHLAASLDRTAREGLSVRETATRHGLSERSLRRVSNTLFGYGPKTLMQIHRFQRALHMARTGMSLSDVAATTGYTDQAHLARETKRFAEKTPTELARAV